MKKITELVGLMLAARFPLLYVVSAEEETAEEQLCLVATERKSQIYFWDFARGWNDTSADKGNPMNALGRVSKAPADQSIIFVMKDLGCLIAPGSNGQITAGQLPLVREIKNRAREISRDRRCIVILSDQLRLPTELREETTVVDFALPSIDEISELVDHLVDKKLKVSSSSREQLLKACQGLSRCRISRGKSKMFGNVWKG